MVVCFRSVGDGLSVAGRGPDRKEEAVEEMRRGGRIELPLEDDDRWRWCRRRRRCGFSKTPQKEKKNQISSSSASATASATRSLLDGHVSGHSPSGGTLDGQVVSGQVHVAVRPWQNVRIMVPFPNRVLFCSLQIDILAWATYWVGTWGLG